jgi:dTDP-4-amino-4,6-dideoxygalactose transaminase
MDPSCAAAAITSRTRALIPVHLYGRPVDMRPFEELASRHNLAMMEDCAQAHGASIGGRTVGSSGRLTCYSFYPGKNLGAYGDGGAVTTSDAQLAERVRILRDHGSPQKYSHSVVGYNSRLDALQAAVLSVKLPHLRAWNAARRRHADKLAAALEDSPIVPPRIPADRISSDQEHVFHLFVVRCSRRDHLQQFLAAKGIQTGIHYPVPLHLTGAYQALGAPGRGSLPIAETLAAEILSLPMYPELSDEQISYLIAALGEFLGSIQPQTPELFSTVSAASGDHGG